MVFIFKINKLHYLNRKLNLILKGIFKAKQKKTYNVVCFEFSSTFARFLSQLPEKLITVK